MFELTGLRIVELTMRIAVMLKNRMHTMPKGVAPKAEESDPERLVWSTDKTMATTMQLSE